MSGALVVGALVGLLMAISLGLTLWLIRVTGQALDELERYRQEVAAYRDDVQRRRER